MLLNASISKNRSPFQVPAAKLTKDAFWTKVDEERLASESLMEKLVDKFGTKPVPKSVADMNGDGANGGIGGKKKGKELRVLDQKVICGLCSLVHMHICLAEFHEKSTKHFNSNSRRRRTSRSCWAARSSTSRTRSCGS